MQGNVTRENKMGVMPVGKLLVSMSQGSEPWRMDPITLETLGPDNNWSKQVPDGVASHYKLDPATGEMIFFNYP